MKKCPYCAEFIQDEAIYCRYCKKSLVGDVYNEETKTIRWDDYLAKQDERILPSEKIIELFNLAASSYEPDNMFTEIIKKINSHNHEYNSIIGEILGLFIKYKLLSEDSIKKLGEEVFAIYLRWANLCLTLGIEHGKNSSLNEFIPYSLEVFNYSHNNTYFAWLESLHSKGKITKDDVLRIARILYDWTAKYSYKFEQLGWLYSNHFTPNYSIGERSKFLIALNDIDVIGRVKRARIKNV